MKFIENISSKLNYKYINKGKLYSFPIFILKFNNILTNFYYIYTNKYMFNIL